MITNEDKFYYENEINGILSIIPFEYVDFYDAVDLWTTTKPYMNYDSASIRYRLMPAFENKQLMLFKKGINSIGFITWAWMTNEEYVTNEYYGNEIFARDNGDKFVVVDAIMNGGVRNVRSCVKQFVDFGAKYYPEVDRAHFHRIKETDRNGNIYNKGYR